MMAHFESRKNVCFHPDYILQVASSTRSLIFTCLFCNLVSSGALDVTPGHSGANACVCAGDNLIYNCTVHGSTHGITIWNGSAFSDCLQNEITLLHSRFTSTGDFGLCNNGTIVARSLGVQGNNFTSQLNITLTPDIAGKTIMCAYHAFTTDPADDRIMFSAAVPGQYPPPNTLHISAANFISKELTFTWSSVAPDCPTIHYNILASNCGSCPTTTNHTNVACTDVPTNGSNCTLAVQTVACRNITGNISEPISIIFYPTRAYSDATESVGTHNLDCNLRAHTASIGFLATALIISVVVSIIGITIVLTKSKIIAIFGRSNSEDEGSTHVHVHAESSYEEVAVPSPSVRLSIISTQDNIAYGLTNT